MYIELIRWTSWIFWGQMWRGTAYIACMNYKVHYLFFHRCFLTTILIVWPEKKILTCHFMHICCNLYYNLGHAFSYIYLWERWGCNSQIQYSKLPNPIRELNPGPGDIHKSIYYRLSTIKNSQPNITKSFSYFPIFKKHNDTKSYESPPKSMSVYELTTYYVKLYCNLCKIFNTST